MMLFPTFAQRFTGRRLIRGQVIRSLLHITIRRSLTIRTLYRRTRARCLTRQAYSERQEADLFLTLTDR